MTTSGTITEFAIPTSLASAILERISAGPDGALWFTEQAGNNIARITTSGTITEYPIPTADAYPTAIAAGPDGALWFTEDAAPQDVGKIGRITTSGVIIEYPVPTSGSGPTDITAGPDGAMWFIGLGIGRITTPLSRDPNTNDFDGDRKSDILWQNTSGQAAVWLMNGPAPITKALVGGALGRVCR